MLPTDEPTRRVPRIEPPIPSACPAAGCCPSSDRSAPHGPPTASRRDFLKLAGASAASMAACGAGGAAAPQGEANLSADHFVPVDKKLAPEWLASLTAKGGPTWYSGDDLETIAMPVGGICAGHVYLTGDGRLVHWDVFNERNFTGYGATCYQLGRKPDPVLTQGFALKITSDGKTTTRTLDREGFPGVRFCGEYPIGTVEYCDKDVPVKVKLDAFSPFIPLATDDSCLPAILLEYEVTNTSAKPVEVTLAGWLQNAICLKSGAELSGVRINGFNRCGNTAKLYFYAKETPPQEPPRPSIVLADFEGENYGDWTVEGEAFGTGPAQGTLERQQPVSGYQGKRLVNTYLGGSDAKTGKLTSPAFTIERRFISFLVGGGNEAEKTCINLLVDGKVVHTAVGKRDEKLVPHNWDVAELKGKQARIEIVDAATGPWGHVNIDQIELRDTPRAGGGGPMKDRPDYGNMGLAVLGEIEDVVGWASLPDGKPADALFGTEPVAIPALTPEGSKGPLPREEKPLAETLIGAIGKRLKLEAGEGKRVVFAVTWCFPNRPEHGNYYATKHGHALALADYLNREFDRLDAQTRLWHDTWYDSTLPHWLLDRLFSTVSTLATGTCLRWANGRFWAWEGVGCCHGTCTHVWNYEHAMARLFPELERSAREMQDYNPEAGFVPETGMVRFRGEGWKMWAGDGQAGTVLKAYREHQMSADGEFLKRNYEKIRRSLEFLINEDKNDDDGSAPDGVLTGSQHNTYDINFFGANTMIGSLYLAALRAGEEMAGEMGDAEFAARCRKLFEAGSRHNVDELFGGEYFIQQVDLEKHPKAQYAGGCLSDQLFGQGWAHQVGLGRIYTDETVLSALRSIWKYNWAPDVGPQNAVHKPERWFASPGEAGLFTCTWPHAPYLPQGVRYKNEVWTGIEYQVAGNMAWEGMATEALAICRGIHDRYHPSKHNPWNEVECGDHYARGMASYGVFTGLCGFEYHGPKGHLGFAPRITPERFRGAFTAAEGWGTLSQERTAQRQVNRIEVKWGKLRLKTLAFELAEDVQVKGATVSVAGKPVEADLEQDGKRLQVALQEPVFVEAGQALEFRQES